MTGSSTPGFAPEQSLDLREEIVITRAMARFCRQYGHACADRAAQMAEHLGAGRLNEAIDLFLTMAPYHGGMGGFSDWWPEVKPGEDPNQVNAISGALQSLWKEIMARRLKACGRGMPWWPDD